MTTPQTPLLEALEAERERLERALGEHEAWRALQQLEAREAAGEWFDAIEGGLLRDKLLSEVDNTATAQGLKHIKQQIEDVKAGRAIGGVPLAPPLAMAEAFARPANPFAKPGVAKRSAANGHDGDEAAGEPAFPVSADTLAELARKAGFEKLSTQAVRGGDDLTRIDGINTALAAGLHGIGVATFAEIAAWRADEVARVTSYLGLGQQISDETWIEQARALMHGRARGLSDDKPTPVEAAPALVPVAVAAAEAPRAVAARIEPTPPPAPIVLARPEPAHAAIEIVPPSLPQTPRPASPPPNADAIRAVPTLPGEFPAGKGNGGPAKANGATWVPASGAKSPRAVLGPSLRAAPAPPPRPLAPPKALPPMRGTDAGEAQVTIIPRGPIGTMPPPLPDDDQVTRRPILPGVAIPDTFARGASGLEADVTITRPAGQSGTAATSLAGAEPQRKVNRFLKTLTGE